MARPIKNLRWWIGGLLFLSTVVNYIDRQTLSMLAPFLKEQYHWSNTDYMWLIIAFRIAYSVGQTIAGRLLDKVGTRQGLSFAVLWYSLAAWLTAAFGGMRTFPLFRFLSGLGEAGNWPGATKAVSEWFPRKESGWAVALFDSGSSIGGMVAGLVIVPLYLAFGQNWRPLFLLTGSLGLLWLLAFRWLYQRPETHPRITPEERQYILAGRADQSTGATVDDGPRLSYATLLRLPQTWGYVLSKSLTDPVWFFITDWFPIFIVAKGFRLESSLVAVWVPFLAADAGNFFGGGFSSFLIKRGWSVGAARKAIAVMGGIGMTLLIPAMWTDSLAMLVVCFAISTFCYAAFSTIILNLPADVYPTGTVATVSGMGGTGAGIGTILATLATGYIADHYSFEPILFGAGTLALVAMAAVLMLVRNNRATEEGLVNRI